MAARTTPGLACDVVPDLSSVYPTASLAAIFAIGSRWPWTRAPRARHRGHLDHDQPAVVGFTANWIWSRPFDADLADDRDRGSRISWYSLS